MEEEVVQEVVRLVNGIRRQEGLTELTMDSLLSQIAWEKCRDMASHGYFGHQSPTYGSPFEMLDRYGVKYSAAGENLAKGQKTASAVVEAWMKSESHRANLLNRAYTRIGVGLVRDSRGILLWAQLFTGL